MSTTNTNKEERRLKAVKAELAKFDRRSLNGSAEEARLAALARLEALEVRYTADLEAKSLSAPKALKKHSRKAK